MVGYVRRSLLGAGTVIVLVTGCAGGATSSPGGSAPSPEPSVAPATGTAIAAQLASATPPMIPSPNATAATDGATQVTGIEEFVALNRSGTRTMVDGVEQLRGNEVELKDTMSDARVSGNGTSRGNYDNYGGVAVQWGIYQLGNAGGSWEGPWAGVVYPGMIEDATAWLAGQGGYAGLTYYLHFRGPVGGPYEITGLIYPGQPPTR